MSTKIVRANELPQRFRMLVYGRAGSGKTRLASTAPKVLLIDVNDEGEDSVRNDFNPSVYRVKFWSELSDVYWFLQEGDHPFESVAVDGLTAMQELAMKFVLGDEASRDASRDPDMPGRQVWGKVGELMKTQIINYRNLPMNVIFTATDRKRVVGDEDDEELDITVGPALSPSVAGTAERAVGLLGYLHKKQVKVISRRGGKKRSNIVVRRRLLIDDPSERYQTKDRYHFGSSYIDGPDIPTMLDAIYGNKEA